MKRNQKGITLVALVITIIVLLILAGVTIASLTGDNGILDRGKEAKDKDQESQVKDLISIAANEGMQEYYALKYVDGATSTLGNSVELGTAQKAVVKSIEKLLAKDGNNKIAGVAVTHNSTENTFKLAFSGGTKIASVDINGTVTYR